MPEHPIPLHIFVGKARPLPQSGQPSGIFKYPLAAPTWLGIEGFEGDQQADLRVHGGPDKAVHLYPATHYAELAEHFPGLASQLVVGCLGENLSTPALTEHDVAVGDVWQLGDARLQLTQPRSPCWKIDDRLGEEGVASVIARRALTGWYWRVLSPGRVRPDDGLTLIDRPSSPWMLAAAMALMREHRPDPEGLRQLAATPGIAARWQSQIKQRLDWLASHART